MSCLQTSTAVAAKKKGRTQMEAAAEKPNGRCTVCGQETAKTCGKCRKVHYCSKEHQLAHRKEHKEECYPGEIKFDEKLGYHMVSTRPIRKGEWIFKEKPLFLAPNGNLKNLRKICLGCCDIVKDCKTCTKCRWPVCSSVCENAPQHAKFECKIFAENKIPKPKIPYEFEVVGIIRLAITKKENPEKWKKILSLSPEVGIRLSVNEVQLHNSVADILKFLKKTCNMKDVDIELVKTIYNLLNRSLYSPGRLANRIGIQLYHKSGKIATECVPNIRIYDEEPDLRIGREKAQFKPLFQVKVMATNDIKEGEMFKQFFGDSVLATLERRAFLKDEFDFECFCARCVDATELGTYLTAVKCTSDTCKQTFSDPNIGYYLPIDPTDEASLWKCNKCENEATYMPEIYDIISKVSEESTLTIKEVRKFNEMPQGTGLLKAVMKIDNTLQTLSGISAHKNNYILIPLKVQLLSEMYNFLACVTCETPLFSAMASRMTELALEVLQVIDVIFPGMTVIRGKILFYLTTSRWYTMKWNIVRSGGDYLKFFSAVGELSRTKDESQAILQLEPLESIENAMASALNNIDLFRSKYSTNLLKQEIHKSRTNM